MSSYICTNKKCKRNAVVTSPGYCNTCGKKLVQISRRTYKDEVMMPFCLAVDDNNNGNKKENV